MAAHAAWSIAEAGLEGRLIQTPHVDQTSPLQEVLLLAHCRLDFEAIQKLGASLKHNQYLRCLDLSYNHMGDEGAKVGAAFSLTTPITPCKGDLIMHGSVRVCGHDRAWGCKLCCAGAGLAWRTGVHSAPS